MMQESVKAVHAKAAELGRPAPKLIAVTILTSINEEQYADLNYKTGIAEQVIALAKLAKESGMDGVVASPQEAAAIREACGEGFLIVTPGIRPAGSDVNDQSRIATPSGALKNGSTHIVVGRPITKAEDKKAAAQSIAAEIRGVYTYDAGKRSNAIIGRNPGRAAWTFFTDQRFAQPDVR